MQIDITPSIIGLQQITARGFQPKAILDIGAHQGKWSCIARAIFPQAYIFMLEAQQHMADQLQHIATNIGNASSQIALVGDSNISNIPFHVTKGGGHHGTGSSIFKESGEQETVTELREMQTLDSILSKADVQEFDFIKLDVQGAELKVLAGAPKTLAKAEFVMLEASLLPYNEGAPMLAEIIAWMQAHDFVVYDVMDLMRLPEIEVLLQVDLLFVRQSSDFRPQPPYV